MLLLSWFWQTPWLPQPTHSLIVSWGTRPVVAFDSWKDQVLWVLRNTLRLLSSDLSNVFSGLEHRPAPWNGWIVVFPNLQLEGKPSWRGVKGGVDGGGVGWSGFLHLGFILILLRALVLQLLAQLGHLHSANWDVISVWSKLMNSPLLVDWVEGGVVNFVLGLGMLEVQEIDKAVTPQHLVRKVRGASLKMWNTFVILGPFFFGQNFF